MIYAPSFSVIPIFIYSIACKTNVFQRNFLLFARHPAPLLLGLVALILIVHPLCERNFKKWSLNPLDSAALNQFRSLSAARCAPMTAFSSVARRDGTNFAMR